MATIRVNKNKDGEVISYRFKACMGRDERGKQIWRTTTVKRPEGLTPAKESKEIRLQADTWEQAQREAYTRGHVKQDKDKITFEAFVRDHWWADNVMDGTHTPSTIEFYRYMKDDLIQYFGKKVTLQQIDAEAVKRYIKYMNTEAKTKQGKPYSSTTVLHHFNVLRIIMEYAAHFEYIDKDPCQQLTQKERPRKEKKKVDFLSTDEVKEYLRCLESEPIFWQALENLLIITGLRRGEVIGLQWGDFSEDHLTINVTRNVTPNTAAESKYHIGKTKGKDARTVPITNRVYSLLMQWKTEQQEKYGIAMPNAFIFNRLGDLYTPLYPTEPTRWQRKFVKRHGLPNMSPHDLRHTAASLALAGGADLKEVQELLGHKDASTTMEFYLGITKEQQRRTVEAIEALIV